MMDAVAAHRKIDKIERARRAQMSAPAPVTVNTPLLRLAPPVRRLAAGVLRHDTDKQMGGGSELLGLHAPGDSTTTD